MINLLLSTYLSIYFYPSFFHVNFHINFSHQFIIYYYLVRSDNWFAFELFNFFLDNLKMNLQIVPKVLLFSAFSFRLDNECCIFFWNSFSSNQTRFRLICTVLFNNLNTKAVESGGCGAHFINFSHHFYQFHFIDFILSISCYLFHFINFILSMGAFTYMTSAFR